MYLIDDPGPGDRWRRAAREAGSAGIITFDLLVIAGLLCGSLVNAIGYSEAAEQIEMVAPVAAVFAAVAAGTYWFRRVYHRDPPPSS